MAIAEALKVIRRKPNRGNTKDVSASGATLPIRLSGTSPAQVQEYERNPSDAQLGNDDPNGRTGNDWYYPDNERGRFDVSEVNGDRLQDQTSRHLHEGEAPGRVPRAWNNRVHGKVSGVSGSPSGLQSVDVTITGQPGGGEGEAKYVPHTPTPRNTGIARTYLRTIDDAAYVPGVYVSDPTQK